MTTVVAVPCPTCGRPRNITTCRHHTIAEAAARNCISCGNRGRKYTGTPAHTAAQLLADEIVWLRQGGEPWHTIPDRLGTTAAALERRFYRAGMVNMARPFSVLNKRVRTSRRKVAA